MPGGLPTNHIERINDQSELASPDTAADYVTVMDATDGIEKKTLLDNLGIGGGSPGGSDTQFQYNNSGAFAGLANLTTDGTNVSMVADSAQFIQGASSDFSQHFETGSGELFDIATSGAFLFTTDQTSGESFHHTVDTIGHTFGAGPNILKFSRVDVGGTTVHLMQDIHGALTVRRPASGAGGIGGHGGILHLYGNNAEMGFFQSYSTDGLELCGGGGHGPLWFSTLDNEDVEVRPHGTGIFKVLAAATVTGILTLEKTSGIGIKVDSVAPTFGWRDILGDVLPRNIGASRPTLAVYRDALREFQFGAGDEEYLKFHIPHDHVAGTDIHLHFHWSHTGTLVTGGTVTFEYEISYSKGHNQAAFPASVSGTVAGTASTTQYQQVLSEGQISAASPSAAQIDTDDLEPDGLILTRYGVQANDITVSGGGVPDPFIHFVDIHYQSTNIATKDKAPDFYA